MTNWKNVYNKYDKQKVEIYDTKSSLINMKNTNTLAKQNK